MSPKKLKVVAFGECMIELRTAGHGLMRQSFAGDTLNTCIYLARLADGAYSVDYATAIGDGDPYSDGMLAAWTDEGIGAGLALRRQGELPGLYAISVDETGERSFHYWRRDAAVRRYFDAPSTPLERQIGDIDLFYVSGISLAILPPAGRDRLLAAMAAVKTAGGRVVFDNNYRPKLWASAEEALEVYRRAYALADIALVTLGDEIEVLGGIGEADAIETICGYPCPEIVIKRGAAPVLLCLAGKERGEVAVEPVARVVDTTAAGDSFGAGYLAARLRGMAPAEAAAAGSRLAATVIQHPGAIIPLAAMPKLF